MSNARIFNALVGTVALAFAVATGWLWHGSFVAYPVDTVTEIPLTRLDIPLAGLTTGTAPVPRPSKKIVTVTTTPTTVAAAVASSTRPVSVTTTAVSPLTGTLELTAKDINLDVPYTSQAPERNWEQPWQDACEEASALMLDAYYQHYGLSPLAAKDELQKIIAWETERGWGNSIGAAQIKILLEDYFKIKRPVRIVTNPSVEQIKKFLAAGHPVIAVVSGRTLPNPFYSNGGPVYHVLVIRGYTKDKFITNDPGVNRGKNFVFKISDVMNALHDWNGGDTMNGVPTVLIVE